ncbi:MAG: HAMP domain-containing protein [Myxococcales bacterium]|nr:HAMP domain-containing protein [Myxococcales bacterium]
MFRNMKIAKRLMLAFAMIVVLLTIISVLSITRLSEVNKCTVIITEDRYPKTTWANDVIKGINEAARALRNALLTGDPKVMEEELERLDAIGKKVTAAMDNLEKTLKSADGKKLLEEIAASREKYYQARKTYLQHLKAGEKEAATTVIFGELRTAQNKYIESAEKLIKFQSDAMDESAKDAAAIYASARTIVIALSVIAILAAMGLGFWLSASITKPLSQCVDAAGRVAQGDLNFSLETDRADETGQLMQSMQEMIERIKTMVDEVDMLSAAAVQGKLAVRADANKQEGDFRKIVQGVNDTLDAVIGPLNVAAKYVDRISKGDIPAKITDSYNGDFNEIKNNLNQCIEAVNLLVIDANALSDAAIEGRLDTRAEAGKHQGDFRKIVQGVNETLDSLVGHIDNIPSPVMIVDRDFTVRYMNKAGAGAGGMTKQQVVGTKCYDFFKTSDCRTAKCACSRAMSEKRNASSETDAHPGSLNLDIAYVGAPIADRHGNIVGALEIVTDQTAIKQAARLAAKTADYQAQEVKKLTEGLNKMAAGNLDFHLDAAAGDSDTEAVKRNFTVICEAVNTSVKAVKSLAKDAQELAQAAIEGKLATRADADKHQGDFRKIVQGVNDTLDAVIQPINEAAQALERLAERDLTARVHGNYNGDLAKIKNSVNTMAEALHESISQVSLAVEQISSAAGQIAKSSQSVAQGASEQASSVEETSSSLEELTSMTQQNTDNTKQAKGMAAEANGAAQTGGQAMNKMLDAMGKIRSSSENTMAIIKDINDIAFQTNLLALNAAVEAARAGEAGRGFAVVAEEVRNLAQRSKEAAKKTEDLIKESAKLAAGGEVISTDVNSHLSRIMEAAGKVASIIEEIAAASQEQTAGLDQVNKAISQIDTVTQQNAANSEESSSAAEELSGQAQELAALVGTFKISATSEAKRPLKAAPVLKAAPAPAAMAAGKKRTNGNGHASKDNRIALRPEDLIPLDNDPDLREF